MHLRVDFFRDLVYISHKHFNIIQLILPLLDHIFHHLRLSLSLHLLDFELLM